MSMPIRTIWRWIRAIGALILAYQLVRRFELGGLGMLYCAVALFIIYFNMWKRWDFEFLGWIMFAALIFVSLMRGGGLLLS